MPHPDRCFMNLWPADLRLIQRELCLKPHDVARYSHHATKALYHASIITREQKVNAIINARTYLSESTTR